jgi:predicted GNAT family N-acyltransferase
VVLPIDFATPEFDEALKLRYLVLREPLGLDYTSEDIENEYADLHFAWFDQDQRINGFLSYKIVDDITIKMRQVAVDLEKQGQGIGHEMVRFTEDFFTKKGYSKIILHARITAVPFYKKLEYKSVGKEFLEVGIPHFKMEKNIG